MNGILQQVGLRDYNAVLPLDHQVGFIPEHTEGVETGFRVTTGEQQTYLPSDAPEPSPETGSCT